MKFALPYAAGLRRPSWESALYIDARKDTLADPAIPVRLGPKTGMQTRWVLEPDERRTLCEVSAASATVLAFDRNHTFLGGSLSAQRGAHGWIVEGELTRQARRDFAVELSASRDDLDLYGEALCQIPDGLESDPLIVQLQRASGGLVLARVPECVWPSRLDRLLTRVFSLTPAEVEIMRGVFEHSSVEALASVRCRTVRTIRTQLSAIYAKTGLKSQADIVRFIAKLAD